MKTDEGSFRSLLAAVLLLVAGVLTVIYGIAQSETPISTCTRPTTCSAAS